MHTFYAAGVTALGLVEKNSTCYQHYTLWAVEMLCISQRIGS